MQTPQKSNGAPLVAASETPSKVSTNPILPRDPKTLRRWLAYKLTPRADGSVEKSPINIATGGFASSNDPSTWAEYADARAYCVANPDHVLGFALGKEIGLTVVDFDKVRKPGEPLPQWVLDEQEKLDSFNEDSCSGTGAHTWCWATIPANRNNQRAHVEIHDSARMFAVSDGFADNWQKIQARDVSELWRRIDKGDIGPNHRKPIIAYSYNEPKFRALCAGQYEAYFSSKSEAVGSVLCTLMQKYEGDGDAVREEFEATTLRELWGEKWDRRADVEIERALKWYEEKKAKGELPTIRVLEFKLPQMPKGPSREYVLLPLPTVRFSGWFPRGAVSIIGGSSNAGKTTLMLDLLDKQKRGQKFLGRDGAGLSFLWLSADRGAEDNLETLERLELLDAKGEPKVDLDYLNGGLQGFTAVAEILRKIEDHGCPAVVFIEGADALVEDPSKTQVVGPFLTLLRHIAERYRIAIILSAGSPKAKPGEVHILKRDRIFGSQCWPRMTSTVLVLSYVGDGAEPQRELDVSYKNAKPEKFALEFDSNGRLVPRIEAPDLDAFDLWVRQQDWWTRSEAVKAMEPNAADSGMSRATVYKRIAAMLAEKKLERRSPEGKEQLRWRLAETAVRQP